MIISFEVGNFRSIFDRQSISFVASKRQGSEEGLIRREELANERLLPALLVYGPNASGKTNLINAFAAMAHTITFSQTHGRPEGRIQTREQFRLDPAASGIPTQFQCDFLLNGSRYNYGFSITERTVEEEWLYAYPFGTPRQLFHRHKDNFKFGRSLKGKNALISQITRHNSLFLSAAAQSNHDQLTPIYKFFGSLDIDDSDGFLPGNAEFEIRRQKWVIDQSVIDFLSDINTGIVGYRAKDAELPKDRKDFERKLNEAISVVMREVYGDDQVSLSQEDADDEKVIEFEHRGAAGQTYFLPMSRESAGTLRLLATLPKVFSALKNGTALIIDELDVSLHTQAAAALVRLFCSRKTNPNGAQLLATTHDTNLLQIDCLRRDQVWFVDKADNGSSIIYPLTDIQTRPGDNIERGYLQGRFGAVPF